MDVVTRWITKLKSKNFQIYCFFFLLELYIYNRKAVNGDAEVNLGSGLFAKFTFPCFRNSSRTMEEPDLKEAALFESLCMSRTFAPINSQTLRCSVKWGAKISASHLQNSPMSFLVSLLSLPGICHAVSA